MAPTDVQKLPLGQLGNDGGTGLALPPQRTEGLALPLQPGATTTAHIAVTPIAKRKRVRSRSIIARA